MRVFAIWMSPGLHPERHALRANVDADLCVSCGLCAGSCGALAIGPPARTARHQLTAAVHAVGVFAQVEQQLELQPGQLDRPAAAQHLPGVRQDPDLGVEHGLRGHQTRLPQRAEQPDRRLVVVGAGAVALCAATALAAAATALAVLFSSAALAVGTAAPAAADSSMPLPVLSSGDIVVDDVHQRVFVSDPTGGKVVATDYAGTVVGTVPSLPGANGLELFTTPGLPER